MLRKLTQISPLLAASALAADEHGRFLQDEDDTNRGDQYGHEWDFFGDCIGLGSEHGRRGAFVQSDIQSVKQTAKYIRDYGQYSEDGKIRDDVHMKLNMGSFANDQMGEEMKMIAQEIHLDYSNDFLALISEGEMENGMVLDPEVDEEDLMPGTP